MEFLEHLNESLGEDVNTVPAAVQPKLQAQLDNIESGTSGKQEESKRVSDSGEQIGNSLKRPRLTCLEGRWSLIMSFGFF